jgi:hypothetical protein
VSRRFGAPRLWVWLAPVLMFTLCSCARTTSAELPKPAGARKVLIVGIPGLTWDDLRAANAPTIRTLASGGLVGNVSVRVSNNLADAYGTLGAGARVETDPTAGWAFDPDELAQLLPLPPPELDGMAGQPAGAIRVVGISRLRKINDARGFGAKPGLLADNLLKRGRVTAALGNADTSAAALPPSLPAPDDEKDHEAVEEPDPSIHREVALSAMNGEGIVQKGEVGRALLEPDPTAPYRIATSLVALGQVFPGVWNASDLVVVETGDTARADAWSVGLQPAEAEEWRADAVRRADRQLQLLLATVDRSNTMVIVLAPTTPGGPRARGQLRPVIVNGPGVSPGLATSDSTRRIGLITLPDLTATIARQMGVAGSRFADGRSIKVVPGHDRVDMLVDMNARAVTHDRLRTPVSVLVWVVQLAIYLVVIGQLLKGSASRWVEFALACSMAFPLASFVSLTPLWRAGTVPSAVGIVGCTLVLGVGAVLLGRIVHLGAALLILSATAVFLVADMILGASAQLDSIFGYTSVAAGRFYGLGNLGFAILAASALLLAGMIADRGGRLSPLMAVVVILIVSVAIGHPALGDDVGGTLTMAPTITIFCFRAFGKGKLPKKAVVIAIAGAVLMVLAFGAVDLARPAANRTHLGDFLTTTLHDPFSAWLVIKRKAGLALALAVKNSWALVALAAVAVLVFLRRRAAFGWKDMIQDHPGLRAGLDGLVVAAVIGSLVNDSGVAIAGMMLSIAAPWALLVAADLMRMGSTSGEPVRLPS